MVAKRAGKSVSVGAGRRCRRCELVLKAGLQSDTFDVELVEREHAAAALGTDLLRQTVGGQDLHGIVRGVSDWVPTGS